MKRASLLLLAVVMLWINPEIMAQSVKIHPVSEGETLQSIADDYGVTVNELAIANAIIDLNRIRVGQELTIPTTGSAQRPASHTVQHGERLVWIAQRYGVSVDALIILNKLGGPNVIFVGQVLLLPPADVVRPEKPQASTQLSPAVNDRAGTYLVRWGDTLTSIARQFGCEIELLAIVNRIENLNRIFVGQTLMIPGR